MIHAGSAAVRSRRALPALPPHATVPRAQFARRVLGASPYWVYLFVAFEFACQLILLSEAFTGFRAIIRSAALSASIALFFVVPDYAKELKGRRAPGYRWGLSIVGLTCLGIFHPLTSTFISSVASTALALAVIAPLYWVPRLRIDEPALRRLLLMYWVFNTASAFFGALQVAYPGRFQPAVGSETLKTLTMTLANGATMMRPMGLTDMPGGAGVGGLYASLLAIGFLLHKTTFRFRILLIASAALGVYTLYLCQIRVLFIMLVVAFAALAGVLALQGRFARMTMQVMLAAAIAMGALTIARSTAGEGATDRLSTLTEGSVGEVYYSNRGRFLEETVTEILPAYPLGAGLGRHGMISAYFGASASPQSFGASDANPASTPIYTEINWTCWILDGGLLLAVLYAAALFVTVMFVFRTATDRVRGELGPLANWGAVLFGYDLAVVMLTFGAMPFESTLGCDFWVLNGAFFCATLWTPRAGSVTGESAPAARPAVKPWPRRTAGWPTA